MQYKYQETGLDVNRALGDACGYNGVCKPKLGFLPSPLRPTKAVISMYSDSSKDKQTLLSMGFPLDRVECTCRPLGSPCVERLTWDPRGD